MPDFFERNAPAWYPDARRVQSPNYAPGHQGRRAVVLHIAEGGYQSSIDFMATAGVSAHFIVSENGNISQLVSVFDTAYGNGLSYKNGQWISPRNKVVHPTWQLIEPGVNPNLQTISIEHAGFHTKSRPKVQLDATVRLLKWLASWWVSLNPYVPGKTLIGHGMLDTIDRVNCPGPYFNLAMIAKAANPILIPARYIYSPRLPIYQASTLTGPLAGYVLPGEEVAIDAKAPLPGYAANAGHLASGAGFVDLSKLESV